MLFLIVLLSYLYLNGICHMTHQTTWKFQHVDELDLHLPSRAEYVSSREIKNDASFADDLTDDFDYLLVATKFAKLTFPNATFRLVDDHYIGDNGVAHINFRQTIHGIDVDNADLNVNIGATGEVFSYGNSFYTGKLPSSHIITNRNFSEPSAALNSATNALALPLHLHTVSSEKLEEKNAYVLKGSSGAVSDPTVKLVYLVRSDESVTLCWRVETNLEDHWLLTYVDANTSDKIHGVVDYVSSATFQVYKWGLTNPDNGPRTILTNPWNKAASPYTWLSDGTTTYNTTEGNNAIAQSNPGGFWNNPYLTSYRPISMDQRFEYPYSPSTNDASSYINASIVQLFYTVSHYHDLMYLLGFTEQAGNFQWNNSGKGGKDHDYIILNAQDAGGLNNADFTTPPDGQPGKMRVCIWDEFTPNRDGIFDATIVTHEATHGVSNRLTGGPANAACLTALESAGMGEGWSDFIATAIRIKPSDTRSTNYAFGEWISPHKKGIRPYLYSTSMTTNPLTYLDTNKGIITYDFGVIWCTLLYEVMWNLIDKHGLNGNNLPVLSNGIPTDGRYLSMKLVIDGMALQPCNPNFIQGRDAILDADTALTNGSNHCEIWKGFAKRGLGQSSTPGGTNRVASNTIPAGVC